MQFIMKISVAALGLATSIIQMANAEAIEFKFRRFSLPGCPDDHIIHKDVNLDNDKCKTFDKHEPPFHSFKVPSINKHPEFLDHNVCQFIVHEERDCQGKGFTSYDIKDHIDQCSTIGGMDGALSVYVKCEPRVSPIVTAPFDPKSTTTTSTVFVYSHHEEINYGSMSDRPIGTTTVGPIGTTTIHTTLPTTTVTTTATSEEIATAVEVVTSTCTPCSGM